MPEGLTLGASGLVSRQMKRGDRGSVPASRTFAEMFECQASVDAKFAEMAKSQLLLWKEAVCLSRATKI